MTRLRSLAIEIERAIPPIPNPSHELEQYTTPGELAALIALDAASRVKECIWAVDLAAGTCRLAAALALTLRCRVAAIEADARLGRLCREGLERLGVLERVVFVAHRISASPGPLRSGPTVAVTNPPFGVVRRGADWIILEYALAILKPEVVYAILKSGNLNFHRKRASQHGYRLMLLAKSEFPIPASMQHHRSRIRRVSIDVVVFESEGRERSYAGRRTGDHRGVHTR